MSARADRPRFTLYSAPRSFASSVGNAQRTAVRSWLRLGPQCEILLVGNEDGIAEVAADLGVRHLPDVECNASGTPLVSSIVQIAESEARSDLLCYINADILLTQDFSRALGALTHDRFLMIGRRYDIDPASLPSIDNPEWEDEVLKAVHDFGRVHEASGIDYFVHPRGLWPNIPPFALGRAVWDNWLVFSARNQGVPVIDASASVHAVHQNHDYAHHADGEIGVFKGEEAVRNLELSGGYDHVFTIDDATHILKEGKVTLALDAGHLKQRRSRLTILHPWTKPILRPLSRVARRAVRLVTQARRLLFVRAS